MPTAVVAELTGTSPDVWEHAARDGSAPIPHFRVGRCLRWPVVPLRRLLAGLPPLEPEAESSVTELRRSG